MTSSRWCPTCGSENLPHRSYCRHCGGSLEFRCPGCGFSNRVGDRFCGGCGDSLLGADGEPLAGWQPDPTLVGRDRPAARWTLPEALADVSGALAPSSIVAAENRLASIVKADLSGFTAMSELLGDPEEVTIIMNQVFDPLVACVRRYDGYIDNYAGDMIIAFFGTPIACQDGTERAVRAALEMRDEVLRLNERNISHGVELGISTGIATGFGLWSEVGFGASTKKTISGELGDYAALIEKYAERGTVGMCPDTYARVKHIIPGEEQETRVHRPGEDGDDPMFYAGTPEPRPPWLDAALAATQPCVGQDAARKLLGELWAAAAGGAGQVVHLHGEAGSGKTRLLQELAQRVHAAGAPVYAVSGRPLSEALGDDLTRDLRHAMLERHGISIQDTEERTAWLHSLGLAPRSEVADWLAAAAQQEPCLLVLDGLDWAGPDLLDLAAVAARAPVMVALASRMSIGPRRLPENAVRLDLPPLEVDEVIALVAAAVEGEPSGGLVEFVWTWCEGNPLYALEFARLAMEQLDADTVAGSTAFRWLPWRVQELADVAIAGLSDRQRAILLAACVAAEPDDLGFEPVVIGYLVEDPEWALDLQALVDTGLLVETAAGRLSFRHRALWRMADLRMVESVKAHLAARLEEALGKLAAG